ncbi:MAG: branched-chain amino acid ABC transporter permease [Armatimonadetes bacterium]|nr:branched-chain amino acid ABC transporter permease [Armatimonadota bacterium]
MVVQILGNGLSAGSAFALLALGFALIFQTTRFFHFAHGAVVTAGAYLTFLFAVILGWPLWVAAVLAIILAGVLGVLMELGVFRPMRKKGATPFVLLLASLGLFVVIQNVISMIFGDGVKTLRSGVVQEGIPILGARITPIQIWTIAIAVILFVAVSLFLSRTRMGKAMRAVANDPELAYVSGIGSDRIILCTFFIGSCLAAVAAILIALDVDMTPTMGMNALLMGVVAVIIGGVGSVPGAALGGLLLGLARSFGVWQINSAWQDAIAFGILLLFLLFRPQGFFGKPLRKAQV